MATVRVLLIEDDQDDARLVHDLLKDASRANFMIEIANMGQDGLNHLKKGRFDVILLDYRLPDMDGMSLLKEVNRLRYQIPVVLVTSYGDRGLQTRALEEGAVEFLEKGSITTDVLERTCLYAIGLNEKRVRDGSGPGVGQMVEQLVALTRESVQAQMEHSSEIREMRQELAEGLRVIRADSQEHQKSLEKRQEAIAEEIANLSSLRWTLKWIVKHPMVAVLIFICLILVTLLLVLVLNTLDVDKVNQIKASLSSGG